MVPEPTCNRLDIGSQLLQVISIPEPSQMHHTQHRLPAPSQRTDSIEAMTGSSQSNTAQLTCTIQPVPFVGETMLPTWLRALLRFASQGWSRLLYQSIQDTTDDSQSIKARSAGCRCGTLSDFRQMGATLREISIAFERRQARTCNPSIGPSAVKNGGTAGLRPVAQLAANSNTQTHATTARGSGQTIRSDP